MSATLMFVIPLIVAVCSVVTGVLLWRIPDDPGDRHYSLVMFASALWVAGCAGEAAAGTMAAKLWMVKVQCVGLAAIVPCWIHFVYSFTRQRRGIPLVLRALLSGGAAFAALLALTNEYHGLVWTSISAETGFPGLLLHCIQGPAAWVEAVCCYAVLTWGTVLLITSVLRLPHVRQPQYFLIVLSAEIPWLANAMYLMGASPLKGIDLAPHLAALTGMAAAWSMLREDLLDSERDEQPGFQAHACNSRTL